MLKEKIDPKSLDLPYYNKLVKIREIFEKEVDYFPNYCCSFSTKVINILTGLDEVAGLFLFSDVVHACNFDPDNNYYIDLTACQYNCVEEKFLIHNDPYLFIPFTIFTKKHLSFFQPNFDNFDRIKDVEKIVKIALQDPLFADVHYQSIIEQSIAL